MEVAEHSILELRGSRVYSLHPKIHMFEGLAGFRKVP